VSDFCRPKTGGTQTLSFFVVAGVSGEAPLLFELTSAFFRSSTPGGFQVLLFAEAAELLEAEEDPAFDELCDSLSRLAANDFRRCSMRCITVIGFASAGLLPADAAILLAGEFTAGVAPTTGAGRLGGDAVVGFEFERD
jgi:hypothetical protein